MTESGFSTCLCGHQGYPSYRKGVKIRAALPGWGQRPGTWHGATRRGEGQGGTARGPSEARAMPTFTTIEIFTEAGKNDFSEVGI